MAGGENYKNFDTTSIVSSAATHDTIKIGSMRFRKRDLVFGAITLLALLLVLILAIVLAVEVGKKNNDDDSNGSVSRTGALSGNEDLCISPSCLKAAHYQKSNMDEQFSPCDDFYSFACGHYDENNPQTYLVPDVTPVTKIQWDNLVQLIDLLTFPVNRHTDPSYERKLKHLLSSCLNHFDKMELRGTPLVEKVLRPYGPIYFLDEDFDASSFDLTEKLKITHADFWTAAFFSMKVATDQTDWNKRLVELDYGGLGMQPSLFIDSRYASQAIPIYREYIQHVLSMVSIDAGVEINNTKIATFADDVISIESNISLVVYKTVPLINAHTEYNKMSLGELNEWMNGTIDFTAYMKYVFNDYPEMFTDQTKVAVKRLGYFHYLGPFLSTLASSDEGKRQMSNYLVWKLINRYSHDLSWDYVHAKRKLNNYLYGHKDESSGTWYCFDVAQSTMPDAMDAVYIDQVVKKESKEEANRILDAVRDEMLKGIDKLNWMKEQDRVTARYKISNSLYKIGYADYMVDEDYMDKLYEPAKIDDADFFGNILSLNNLMRKEFNTYLGVPNSRTLWAYHIFDPIVEYYNPWHELIATAAVFQTPLFSHEGPAYYNFGTVGSIIAKHLIHAVDEIGNSYRLDGKHFGNWWSNTTLEHYRSIKKCATDAQANTDFGTFNARDGQIRVNVSDYAADYVPELLADASGLRLAYKAFKIFEKTRPEQAVMPAGFPGRTIDQMFFVAFAQANCQNTPDAYKLNQLNYLQYPSKNRVNLAVSQVAEFSDAFQCRPGQPMHPKNQCVLF